MATPPEFSLFEWFFTVDHKVKPGIEARAEKPNLAEITYSCLDDQHTPQFLSRLRNIATELTVPFEVNHQPKILHSSQLEFFYFENDDKEEDILYVACLLHWNSLTIQGIISRKPCFGEFQEILQQIAHLKPSRENLTKLVNGLYHCCKFSHIDIYSFSSSALPSFSVKNKKYKLEDIALAELFTNLDLYDIIDLLCVLLVEGNVYVTSNKLNKISSAIFLITRLIRPFQWQQIKIPLLSPNMLQICSAPLPCIIGIHDSIFEKAKNEIIETNLENAPDKNNTGYYVLVNLDDPDKSARFTRLDNMHNRETRVFHHFPHNHLYALKSGWKSLLKKLTQCEITIDEFAHCAFSNAQRFIAHLILGYKDCYNISDNGDSTDSEKKGNELDFEDGVKFDRDKFIASSCVSSSNQSSSVLKQVGAPSDYRKLLTECQYFEQFIDANRRILRSSSGRQKSENEHYKQFDLVYNWVLRTESEKRNPAAKLGDNFHFKVDTAYSKLTDQTSRFQNEVKSRSNMVRKSVKNKLSEGAKGASIFYVSPPTLISHLRHSDAEFKLPAAPVNERTMKSNESNTDIGQCKSMFYVSAIPENHVTPAGSIMASSSSHTLPHPDVNNKRRSEELDLSSIGNRTRPAMSLSFSSPQTRVPVSQSEKPNDISEQEESINLMDFDSPVPGNPFGNSHSSEKWNHLREFDLISDSNPFEHTVIANEEPEEPFEDDLTEVFIAWDKQKNERFSDNFGDLDFSANNAGPSIKQCSSNGAPLPPVFVENRVKENSYKFSSNNPFGM
ncbi:DENN domain-containing protein 1A-like isoform X2 [Symsagittifera roscoffensis]|uniref:DENN domain-containing protein 1A-like isoform X2 n=1 Tax=Symsagittifera roscoffensis TaxID=84072 RepID=UPI00307B8D2C